VTGDKIKGTADTQSGAGDLVNRPYLLSSSIRRIGSSRRIRIDSHPFISSRKVTACLRKHSKLHPINSGKAATLKTCRA
jgi:hypothetical protein